MDTFLEIEEVFAVGGVDWGQVVRILVFFWENCGLKFKFWREPSTVEILDYSKQVKIWTWKAEILEHFIYHPGV